MGQLGKKAIQALARQYGMQPDRSQGQNFVIDDAVVADMVRAAHVTTGTRVLEIGPGFGSLTIALLEAGATVVAVEQDRRLIPALHKLTSVYPSLHIVPGDIFRVRHTLPSLIQDGSYQLISNLPYNITSKVLRDFLETRPRPTAVTVLVQREVAERVCAEPGAMSILSVAVQLFADPLIIRHVSADSFWPAPAITSTILHLASVGSDHHGYLKQLSPHTTDDFFRIVRIGYSGRRKQLHNTLAAGLKMTNAEVQKEIIAADISPESRPQTLSIEDWIRLVHRFIPRV